MKKIRKFASFSAVVGIFLFLTAVVVLAVSLFANSNNNRVTAHGREGIFLTDDDETEWSEDVSESFNMEDIGHDSFVSMGSLNIKNSSADTRSIYVTFEDTGDDDTDTAALFELEVERDTGDIVYSGTLDVIGEVQFDTLDSLEEGYYDWKIKTTRIVEFNEDLDVDFTLVVDGRNEILHIAIDDHPDTYGSHGDIDFGQSFTTHIDGLVDYIDICTDYNLPVTLIEGQSIIIDENHPLIGVSDNFIELEEVCSNGYAMNWHRFYFDGVQLDINTEYTIALPRQEGSDFRVVGYFPSTYLEGMFYEGGIWQNSIDLRLRVWMIPS